MWYNEASMQILWNAYFGWTLPTRLLRIVYRTSCQNGCRNTQRQTRTKVIWQRKTAEQTVAHGATAALFGEINVVGRCPVIPDVKA